MSCRNRRNRCSSRRNNEGDRDCFRRDERRNGRGSEEERFNENVYDSWDEGDNFEEVSSREEFSEENGTRRGTEREERRGCGREGGNDGRRERNSDRSYIVGNSVDVCVRECDTEVKAKIVVQERDTVRVWGQVVDCQNRGVPFALVKLLREGCRGLESISHTITDCNGFYQFDVCPDNQGREFTILVGKDAKSRERVESRGLRDNNCRGICRRDRCGGGPGDCGGFVR